MRMCLRVLVAVTLAAVWMMPTADPASAGRAYTEEPGALTVGGAHAQDPTGPLECPEVEWFPEGNPPNVTPRPVSLPNGTRLKEATDCDGLGWLKIVNGTSRDAVVKLKDAGPPNTTRRSVYVRANDEVTLPKVVVGTYVLQFMTGMDWDHSSRKFLQDVAFLEFADRFDFQETSTPDGTQYSTWEVTLHPVSDGTARVNHIDAATFARD